MTKSLFVLLTVIIICVCCSKPKMCCEPYQVYYLRAVVVETHNIDCGRPLLDFTDDSARIHQYFSGEKCIITSLPAELNVANKKIYLLITTLKLEENFVCTTMDPSYPAMKLVDAKSRD